MLWPGGLLIVVLLHCARVQNAAKILVPAYIYPDYDATTDTCTDEEWRRMAAGGDRVVAIINPNNGN